MKNHQKKKIVLKYKLDRFIDAFLYSKTWKKYWRKRFENLHWYYRTKSIVKFLEIFFHYKFKNYKIYALGQSHLDAAWKWTKLSTIRRLIITMENAVANLNRYPFFLFSQSSPQYYEWIKNFKPNLFNDIKKLVKEGRFEICGGMWIEADTNLPNGESLVRQRLYGQRFYLENFEKLSKVSFLPDTFGFSGNLPQILIKSGAKYFYTSKITWNDNSKFPFANFYWKGIDGSSIFSHCFYYYNYAISNFSKYKELAKNFDKSGLIFNSKSKLDEIDSHRQDDYIKTCSLFYGFSDGGMGPFEEEIGLMANIGRLDLLKFSSIEKFFKILKQECKDSIPIWNDELYLEFHRGCYTSQAYIKKLNRLSEINVRNLEILSTILHLFSESFEYHQQIFEKNWKIILFNQFHDILPGSSIQDVYYEQEPELMNVNKLIQYLIKKIISLICMYLATNSNINGEEYLIFNPLSWNRNGIITIENENKIQEKTVKNIPSLSFKRVNISDLKEEIKNKTNNLVLEEHNDQIILENKKIQFIINKISGKITSLKLKGFKKEFIVQNKGIGFNIYHNKPPKQYAAWNIDSKYTQKPIKITKITKIKILCKNSQKISVQLAYNFKKSNINQTITLRENSDYIQFHTDLDIKDKNLLIKLRLPIELNSNETISEIPYGAIKRIIIPKTEFQKGKWEFPAQKWIAMSDQNYGIVLANDSKYGFSTDQKSLSMSLLVTTHYPISFYFSHIKRVPKGQKQKYMDLGKHSVNYALKVYQGNWIEANVWKFGYEFNYPCISMKIDGHFQISKSIKNYPSENKLKKLLILVEKGNDFINISEPNIILQVFKSHEKNPKKEYSHVDLQNFYRNNLIIRLYETCGLESKCRIKLTTEVKIKEVFETDLLELKIINKNIKIGKENDFWLNFSPFEIKTVQLRLF